MNATNVVDTMEFYFPNKDFVEVVKKDLAKDNPANLKNARIICFELITKEGDTLSDFKGIDLALEKFMQNPDAPMILTSFMDLNSKVLDDKRNKIKLLLSKPNVKFIRLPWIPSALPKLFEGPEEDKEGILRTITFQMGIDK